MTQQIGYLESMMPRHLFPDEAADFTPWLEQHIEVLGDRLGLTLSNPEREQAVGPFSVDLRAEAGDGGLVVIENQLERTDHDHLGKLLTYLVNLDAKTAIWVSPTPQQEHTRVVQWLNEITPDDMAFYLVRVEVVRIGQSLPAPLFTVMVAPSEEARVTGTKKKELAQRHVQRLEFWTELLKRSEGRTDLFKSISPRTDNWMNRSAGVSGLAYGYVINMDRGAVLLYIDRANGPPGRSDPENEAIFDQFHQEKAPIEEVFGEPLDWDRVETRRSCRITKWVTTTGLADREQWPETQQQMIERMIRLEQALKPHIEQLQLP